MVNVSLKEFPLDNTPKTQFAMPGQALWEFQILQAKIHVLQDSRKVDTLVDTWEATTFSSSKFHAVRFTSLAPLKTLASAWKSKFYKTGKSVYISSFLCIDSITEIPQEERETKLRVCNICG